MPYGNSRRLGWRIDPNSSAYYVFHSDQTKEMSPIIYKPEDLPVLKLKIEPFINELQRRRQEYQEKMEPVYEAIK